MDLVARRDHTEKELRKKLSLRCEPEIIDQAIEWAKEQNWLAAPEQLQERFVQQLHQKGKGLRVINHKLRELGLQTIANDSELEFEKAQKLIQSKKFKNPEDQDLSFEEKQKLKAKIARFLSSRGFDSSIIAKIINEEL